MKTGYTLTLHKKEQVINNLTYLSTKWKFAHILYFMSQNVWQQGERERERSRAVHVHAERVNASIRNGLVRTNNKPLNLIHAHAWVCIYVAHNGLVCVSDMHQLCFTISHRNCVCAHVQCVYHLCYWNAANVNNEKWLERESKRDNVIVTGKSWAGERWEKKRARDA